MSTKRTMMALILLFSVIISIFWMGMALAEAPDGTGPDSAMAPGDWTTIDPGGKHWYVFHFGYDDEAETVKINLYADPENGATFTVRNGDQIKLWRDEGEDEWFGAGSENEYASGDLFWSGDFKSSGTYFVVVEHNALMPGQTAYRLDVSGEGVNFPTRVIEPALVVLPAQDRVEVEVPAPVAAPAMAALPVDEVSAEVSTTKMGGGPDFAMSPTGEWTPLELQGQHWYVFDFGYDEDITEPIEIKIYDEPKGSAVLTVRNEEQAQRWREEGKNEHFGCCVVQDLGDDDETSYALWAGRLSSSGPYYIVVEQAEGFAVPAIYRFTMEGKNFSFPTAEVAPPVEMALEVEAAPLKAAPVEAARAPAPVYVATSPEPLIISGKIGGGPDEALAPTGEWAKLEAGTTHWYAFQYGFDPDFDDVEIKIYAEPKHSAVLTVRNQEQAQLWRAEGKSEHFGCCTPETIHDEETDYDLWLGNPGSTGVYYIVVEVAENVEGPVMYTFTIEGEGVGY